MRGPARGPGPRSSGCTVRGAATRGGPGEEAFPGILFEPFLRFMFGFGVCSPPVPFAFPPPGPRRFAPLHDFVPHLPGPLAPFLRASPRAGPHAGTRCHLGGAAHPRGDGGAAGGGPGLGAGGSLGGAPGMPVSQAVALCPGLTLLEPDPAHYAAAQEAVVEALAASPPWWNRWSRGSSTWGWTGSSGCTDRLPPRCASTPGPPGGPPSSPGGALPGGAGPRNLRRPGRGGGGSTRGAGPGPLRTGRRPGPLPGAPSGGSPSPGCRGVELLHRLGVRTLGAVAALPLPALMRHFGADGGADPGAGPGRADRPGASPAPPPPHPGEPGLSGAGGRPGGPAPGASIASWTGFSPTRSGGTGPSPACGPGGYLEGGGSWEIGTTLREPWAQRDRLAFPLRTRIELRPRPGRSRPSSWRPWSSGPRSPRLALRPERGRRPVPWRGGTEEGAGDLPFPPGIRDAVRELRLRIGSSPLYRVVEVDPWSRIPERRYALLPLEG
jgi:protein ImuB